VHRFAWVDRSAQAAVAAWAHRSAVVDRCVLESDVFCRPALDPDLLWQLLRETSGHAGTRGHRALAGAVSCHLLDFEALVFCHHGRALGLRETSGRRLVAGDSASCCEPLGSYVAPESGSWSCRRQAAGAPNDHVATLGPLVRLLVAEAPRCAPVAGGIAEASSP